MANVSDWSANEKDNLFLDELNLSDQHGRRTAKIMAAVKAKEDEQDAKLDAVAGGLVFRGTKATYADLEAVDSPAVGDMYSVTALGGENYAWNGEAWDALGTSDANVVHKTGDEVISGEKTFNKLVIGTTGSLRRTTKDDTFLISGGTANVATAGSYMYLFGAEKSGLEGWFALHACYDSQHDKILVAKPDGTLTWDGQDIQVSSDERLKTPLSTVPDSVLDAWGDVSWGQFCFLAAIEDKGEENARLHLGLVAQAVKRVFESKGLDATRYGILCHEERPATGEEPAVDVWMVRYAEAQAMEAAYQRRRADRLESRIEALEARLDGNN